MSDVAAEGLGRPAPGSAGEEVQQSERAQRRLHIRKAALLTRPYLVMNGLAAVIASYGLLADSPAVVIGAMIVAMLLGPIMGIALGLTDGDARQILRSTIALLAGIAVVLIVAYGIGRLHPDASIAGEIRSRTRPNLFDLIVALAGGAAAAYATVSQRLSAGLVGVAIATALVPPLCASAILYGRGEASLALGAFLLAATNVAAIQFAAAVVLWVHDLAREGERLPLGRFLVRHALSLIILGALGVLLAGNLRDAVEQKALERAMTTELRRAFGEDGAARVTDFTFTAGDDDTLVVDALLRSPTRPTEDQVRDIERRLGGQTVRGVRLRVHHVLTAVISPTAPPDADAAPEG